MSNKKIIFFTGATGYIGGACLQHLLLDSSLEITALVRNVDKAKKLEGLGIKTVIGSLDESEKLIAASAAADIVYHTAHADHLPAIHAILRGIKSRYNKTGQVPLLFHTSGTGVLADNAAGLRDTNDVYYDNDTTKLEALSPTAQHRDVDSTILAASVEGYVRSYIILPSTIYGTLTGPLVDLGISNAHSISIPFLVNASIARGQGGMVGEGRNVWADVEIHDLANLYSIVFRAAIAGTAPHGREGLYFGENGEYRMVDAARACTRALHALGISKTAEPTAFTKEEVDKSFGGAVGALLGANTRARSVRARELRWKPVKTNEDFLESIKGEVERIVKTRSTQL